MPHFDIMNPKSLSYFTPNVHFIGLSIKLYSDKVVNVSFRSSKLELPCLVLMTMSFTYVSMFLLICRCKILLIIL